MFLLIDKELADKYYYYTSEYTTLSDAVEFVVSVRDSNAGPEILNVRCHVHKRKLEVHGTVEEVKKCTPFLKDLCLILLKRQLIVDILELDRLGVIITSDPADTVLKHPVKRNALLCRLWNAVIPSGTFDDLLYFLLFCRCQVSGYI